MSTNKAATKADLQEMYSRILPYLGGTANAGFTPVGTIISVMGVNTPANYLKCDGTVYNIADYPELANYFYQQFGTKSKFGGNGTTTFAVPDLRGEFLRGTGTNSHTNQGNGADVGTHQDSTQVPYLGMSKTAIYGTSPASNVQTINVDKLVTQGNDPILKGKNIAWSGEWDVTTTTNAANIRPTNTSVLYCIATKNIYMNPSLDYSTDEKVVGTWINSKPIYQKTFVTSIPDIIGSSQVVGDLEPYHIDIVVASVATHYDSSTKLAGPLSVAGVNNQGTYYTFYWWNLNTEKLMINNGYSGYSGRDCYITLQYTKTTD